MKSALKMPLWHWRTILAAVWLSYGWPVTAAENMRFHGALVAEPCVIPPGEESLSLDFGTVIDKYLYLNKRTNGKPFAIHLAECDLRLGKTVSVTFIGTESSALPGLLALNQQSGSLGIAIGLETLKGAPLPLNKPGENRTLFYGGNWLMFSAYVQGEPSALAGRLIERGSFTAIATFSLDYQ